MMDDYLLTHYYCGDAVTGLCGPQELTPSGKKLIVTCTLTGSLLVFVPFPSKEDIFFFQSLERAIEEYQGESGVPVLGLEGESGSSAPGVSLCYRNHSSYRSYFRPAKNTVDGDLCESLLTMPVATQTRIAEIMDKPLGEIKKRVQRVRKGDVLGFR